MTNFPRIDDIAASLSADLEQRGFSKAHPQEKESVRYEKKDSLIGFQVGLSEEAKDAEEPDFNHIYLALGYSLPQGVPQHFGKIIIPDGELMFEFFRNSPLYHHSLCYNEDWFQDGKVNLVYHIGFEKSKTNALEMRAVLREFIDYFCNFVTANIQMLSRTQSFSG